MGVRSYCVSQKGAGLNIMDDSLHVNVYRVV